MTSFCSYEGNSQRPDIDTFHDCDVPERSGYQIILSVWDVSDTAASFFNVIDVVLDATSIPTPTPEPEYVDIGDINPSLDLSEADSVQLRLFTN